MPRVATERLQEFEDYLTSYNECWYKKDLNALRKMYANDGDIIYFDNHQDCESFDINDHMKKVKHFFETGDIINLIYENMIVYENNNSACIIVTFKILK